MPDRFSRDNAYGTILLDWWQKLEDDRASRAILRRVYLYLVRMRDKE